MKKLFALCMAVGLMIAVPVCAEEKGTGQTAETAETLLTSGDSIVINNDGIAEQLTIDDLIKVHSDNQLRWDKNYLGARVLVMGEVTEIKTQEWLVLENDSYTPNIVLHIGNGWLVSGADSQLAETLNIGDKIQFSGTITGFMKYQRGIAVIYTAGGATCVQRAEAGAADVLPALPSMIQTYIDKRNYPDAEFWLDFCKTYYEEDTDVINGLQASLDEALGNCYLGTYLDKYDSMFTCTDVVPCEVESYGEGYDYYDPIFSMDANSYIQHLKNKGFRSTDNKYVTATVNGVTETYASMVNDDNVLVAVAMGDNYVRVLVWSQEACYEVTFVKR